MKLDKNGNIISIEDNVVKIVFTAQQIEAIKLVIASMYSLKN